MKVRVAFLVGTMLACSGKTMDSSGPGDAGNPNQEPAHMPDPGTPTTPPDVESDAATSACPVNDGGVTQLGKFGSLDGGFAPIAAIAADEDGVYVVVDASDFTTTIETTTVYRVPPCGGTPTVLASRTDSPKTGGTFGALAASHRVFVIMGDGIYSVPTTGGTLATETTSTTVIDAPITVYRDQLYWIDGSATLWAVTTGGGHTARVVAKSTAPMNWTSVAADASNAYVTAIPLPADGGAATASDMASGSVLSVSLSDGAIARLASGVYGPGNIVIAGASLYWTSNMYMPSVDTAAGTGSIETLALGGGSLMDVVRNEAPPPGPLMVLGTTIYWINGGGPDGEDTMRMLPAGGTPTTIPMPRLIGLDGLILASSGAYWYNSSDYTFGRIAL
jgi:hypothetical protein